LEIKADGASGGGAWRLPPRLSHANEVKELVVPRRTIPP